MIPVVGAIGVAPLIQGIIGNTITGGAGMGGILPHLPQYVSQRHGPARTWHPNGKLRAEGSHDHDRCGGQWTFYGASGRLTERGDYREGIREGSWQILNAATGKIETLEFTGGRPRAEHERLIAHIQTELSSGDVERQIIAMDRIEELGRHAAPLLLKNLEDSNTHLQLLALRRLERMAIAGTMERQSDRSAFDATTIARIETLLDSGDKRVARSALLLLYRVSPERRDALFPRLLAEIRRFGDDKWRWGALYGLWHTDVEHRPTIFAELAQVSDARSIGHYRYIAFPYSDDLSEILDAASRSDDAKLRRFAIEVVRSLSHAEPREPVAGSKTGQFRCPIPEQLQPIVERAKSDPDAAIREAAASVGLWPDPRLPAFQGGTSF
jgi:hypothetical protein